MAQIRWTEQALNDVENIAEFIAKDSERYAQIQVLRFFDATVILSDKPRAGRIVPEVNKINIREIILGNYRIIYKIVSGELIHILTIHHSARILRIKTQK